jgi:3-deoxy-D-manno-octulosonate 8-phosphate phosphatase (KDO 8-P phosphatase)
MQTASSFEDIKAFFFDMDGVLTDGSIVLASDDMQLRTMNIKDGYGLQAAIKKGYLIFVISGATSLPAQARLQKLGVSEIYMGVMDKHKLSSQEVLYMGDDIPDLAPMQHSGIACSPADAVAEVKSISHFIAEKKGGMGCVREVIEKVLRARGDWEIDPTISSQ